MLKNQTVSLACTNYNVMKHCVIYTYVIRILTCSCAVHAEPHVSVTFDANGVHAVTHSVCKHQT